MAEGSAAAVFVGIGEGRLPTKAEVQRKAGRYFERVLRIEAHDPLPQIVGSGVGLLEVVGRAQHEIREGKAAISAARNSRVPVREPLKVKVPFSSNPRWCCSAREEVEAEGDLMASADEVHVVGNLVAVDVEMPGRAGPAERAEGAVDGQQQEVGHGAVHVDAEHGGIDRDIRRAAVIAHAVEADVERVQRAGAERIGIADGGRLSQLQVAGLRRGQQVCAVVGGRILEASRRDSGRKWCAFRFVRNRRGYPLTVLRRR